MTEIIKEKNRELLDKKAADTIRDSINNLLEKKESMVLAIVGGRSVSGIFKALLEEDIPWEKVHIFIADERLVPIDHEESNFKLANDAFIKQLSDEENMPEDNIHPFILKPESEDKGIMDYENELWENGGVYDIVLLSSGEDGHVAALFPEHHSVKEEADYFIRMDDSPKPPSERMSLSRKLLLRSSVAIVLFYGEGKSDAFKKFNQEGNYEECPARLVKKIKRSYAFTDII